MWKNVWLSQHAATARRFSTSPEHMAIIAAAIGALSVVVGLNGSLKWDTPAGPSIVVAALAGFIISVLPIPKLTVKNASHTSDLKKNFEEVGE